MAWAAALHIMALMMLDVEIYKNGDTIYVDDAIIIDSSVKRELFHFLFLASELCTLDGSHMLPDKNKTKILLRVNRAVSKDRNACCRISQTLYSRAR